MTSITGREPSLSLTHHEPEPILTEEGLWLHYVRGTRGMMVYRWTPIKVGRTLGQTRKWLEAQGATVWMVNHVPFDYHMTPVAACEHEAIGKVVEGFELTPRGAYPVFRVVWSIPCDCIPF